jgi:hypothetical protein
MPYIADLTLRSTAERGEAAFVADMSLSRDRESSQMLLNPHPPDDALNFIAAGTIQI